MIQSSIRNCASLSQALVGALKPDDITLSAVVDLGAAQNASNDKTNAFSVALAETRRLHFPQNATSNAEYGISGFGISISRSHTRLSFEEGARMVPYDGNAPDYFIHAHGSAPTEWEALSNDAAEGQCFFAVDHNTYGIAVGDWVELRSSATLPRSPNSKRSMRSQLAKVISVSGSCPYIVGLDRPLAYNFDMSDGATVGIPNMLEDIEIDHATMNKIDAVANMQRGISLRYCAGVRIIAPRFYRSKNPFADSDISRDFIRLQNCVDVYIEDARGWHGIYYGIGIVGACDSIHIKGGMMHDVRHATSLIWQTSTDYGEPRNVIIAGMTALACWLSGFDEHDIGENVIYIGCTAVGCKDEGFQSRTNGTYFIACTSRSNRLDGFSQDRRSPGSNRGTVAISCDAIDNGRCGFCFDNGYCEIIGGTVLGNGSEKNPDGAAQAGACGIAIYDGLISGVRLEENGWSGSPRCFLLGNSALIPRIGDVLIQNCVAPQDAARQQWLLTSNLSAGANDIFGSVRLRDNRIVGYDNNYFRDNTDVYGKPPVSSGNLTTADSTLRSGTATLAAGSATVSNAAFRNYAGSADTHPVRSKVKLTLVSSDGGVGELYVVPGSNGVGFDIESTNVTDASTVMWELAL